MCTNALAMSGNLSSFICKSPGNPVTQCAGMSNHRTCCYQRCIACLSMLFTTSALSSDGALTSSKPFSML